MTFFITNSAALQARPASRLRNNISIFLIESVASFTKNILRQLDRMAFTSAPILIMRDSLKMFGIDAVANSANMIYLKTIGNFAFKHLVGEPVRASSKVPGFAKISIPLWVNEPSPQPARIRFINVFKKSFFRWLCPAHRALNAIETCVSQLFNKVVSYAP
jgi:hypothetical protein